MKPNCVSLCYPCTNHKIPHCMLWIWEAKERSLGRLWDDSLCAVSEHTLNILTLYQSVYSSVILRQSHFLPALFSYQLNFPFPFQHHFNMLLFPLRLMLFCPSSTASSVYFCGFSVSHVLFKLTKSQQWNVKRHPRW